MMTCDEPPKWLAAKADNNSEINQPSNNDDWKPFASFVVEFQMRTHTDQRAEHRTKAHHIEEDTCAHWPGLESTQLCQWMLQQVLVSVTNHIIQRELALKVM
jgi:hypothetical protein